jgi:hypothetical protein
MDQHSSKNNESPHFSVPEVHVEPHNVERLYEVSANNIGEHSMGRAVENNAMASPLANPTAPPTTNQTPMQDPSTAVNPAAVPHTAPHKITVTDNIPAREVDLIEKAWVVKAKAIVEQTKHDPYEQSDEIKKMRNEYQSKRFHTNIKTDNE